MTDGGWKAARIDELDALPVLGGRLMWHPVRRHFGLQSFGINAYTADDAGRLVVEEHDEAGGHEELYYVVTGSATFTLDGTELVAGAGTFVHVQPGTTRVAVADVAGTTVIGIGARTGEVFTPSPWEGTFAAYGYLALGDAERARAEMNANIAENPDAWQGPYHLACIESLAGSREAALDALARAVALGGDDVVRRAASDTDFDAIRDDPRFPVAE